MSSSIKKIVSYSKKIFKEKKIIINDYHMELYKIVKKNSFGYPYVKVEEYAIKNVNLESALFELLEKEYFVYENKLFSKEESKIVVSKLYKDLFENKYNEEKKERLNTIRQYQKSIK